jgi:hypothetical protein
MQTGVSSFRVPSRSLISRLTVSVSKMTKKRSDEQILAEGLALMVSPNRKVDDAELELIGEALGLLIHAVREIGRLKQRLVAVESRCPGADLLAKMLKAGISQYEPDPLAALKKQ